MIAEETSTVLTLCMHQPRSDDRRSQVWQIPAHFPARRFRRTCSWTCTCIYKACSYTEIRSSFHLQARPQSSSTMTGRRPSLPQELVEYIIDILWDQHATLRSCSLVSQAWCPRCRYHLRRVVVLSDSDDEAKAALYRDPSITSSVRHLTIRTLHQSQWLSWFPNILPIVEDMKHVTRLRIHVVNWGVRLGDGFFRAQRSSLTHLTLDGVNFDSFATFTYVTAAFHKLESLTLLYVRWVSRLGPVRYEDWADGSKLNLKTLRLGWVFSALAGNLKGLVGWLKRGRSTPLCIQHFAFGATNPEDPELQEPMLQLSSCLREIEIFQRIHSWPSLLGSSQTLDATLADKRFTLLASVTIVGITSDPKLVNCTDMHQMLDEKLPQLAQRQEVQSKLRIQHTYPQWNEKSKFLNGSYEGEHCLSNALRSSSRSIILYRCVVETSSRTILHVFPSHVNATFHTRFLPVSFAHPSELMGGFSFCDLVPIDAAPYRRLRKTPELNTRILPPACFLSYHIHLRGANSTFWRTSHADVPRSAVFRHVYNPYHQ